MKTIVILTGDELRHRFFRKAMGMSPGLRILRSFCQTKKNSLLDLVEKKSIEVDEAGREHLKARQRSEEDFFASFVRFAHDDSHPVVIDPSELNSLEVFEQIRELQPDLLVAYGCSIIKDPLLSAYEGHILNVHLGLSPYYRGAGTNFWPLVNGEPEFVGATFMYLDAGVDTGEIIHQIRARIFPGDTPHQIGNRLICDVAVVYAHLIRLFDRLGHQPQLPPLDHARYYRKRDYNEHSVLTLYKNFADGMVEHYLTRLGNSPLLAPIVEHPLITKSMEEGSP